jgi:hypothetical protein
MQWSYLMPLNATTRSPEPSEALCDPAVRGDGRVRRTGFGVAEEVIAQDPRDAQGAIARVKVWDWFPFTPGAYPYHDRLVHSFLGENNRGDRPRHVASSSDEWTWLLILRLSRFAWTHARAGLDCMRHYEILSQGALPYFPDIPVKSAYSNSLVGENAAGDMAETMTHLPAALIQRVWALRGIRHIARSTAASAIRIVGGAPVHVRWTSFLMWDNRTNAINILRPGTVMERSFDQAAYDSLVSEALAFTRQSLTASSVVRKMLTRVPACCAHRSKTLRPECRVLFLGTPHVDYMGCTVMHGLDALGVTWSLANTHEVRFHALHPPPFFDEEKTPLRELSEEVRRALAHSGGPALGGLYEGWVDLLETDQMYGKGFLCGARVSHPGRQKHSPAQREVFGVDVCAAISSQLFDVVLYTTGVPASPVSLASTVNPLIALPCGSEAADMLAADDRKAVVVVDGSDRGGVDDDVLQQLSHVRGVHVHTREGRATL